MNGESKRNFVLALASFMIGALVAGILGSPTTRAKISESGKNLMESTKNLANRNDLA